MKSININIPEGYEIDIETSDLVNGKIIFKPIEKKWRIAKSEYWFFDASGSPVRNYGYHWLCSDAYPSKELLLAFEALRKLYFFRNEVWKKDNNWEPAVDVPENKHSIFTLHGVITTGVTYRTNPILSFRTEELRDQFLKDHEHLINKARPLI